MASAERVEVKVCGIVRPQDALAAARAGADAIGLIFVAYSPRVLGVDDARQVAAAAAGLCRVGVFADADMDEIVQVVESVGLHCVQLHGAESPAFCEALARRAAPCRVIKAVRFGERVDYGTLRAYEGAVAAVLVDGPFAGGPLPWHELADWGSAVNVPLILAGGLSPDNVTEAVRLVRPAAVDVARGVERDARAKDERKIEAFVSAVRACGVVPHRPGIFRASCTGTAGCVS